jgi:hypothetical protein
VTAQRMGWPLRHERLNPLSEDIGNAPPIITNTSGRPLRGGRNLGQDWISWSKFKHQEILRITPTGIGSLLRSCFGFVILSGIRRGFSVRLDSPGVTLPGAGSKDRPGCHQYPFGNMLGRK